MKIEHIIDDREGWYNLTFCFDGETGLRSASLRLPRDYRKVSANGKDEAARLLDVLLIQLKEERYRNDSFLLQRTINQVEDRSYKAFFPSCPYDLFALVGTPFARDWNPQFSKQDRCEYIGSLPPHKFVELSSKLTKHYSAPKPLGKTGRMGPPWPNHVPDMHEWEGYYDLPGTPTQWIKQKWAELKRNATLLDRRKLSK